MCIAPCENSICWKSVQMIEMVGLVDYMGFPGVACAHLSLTRECNNATVTVDEIVFRNDMTDIG